MKALWHKIDPAEGREGKDWHQVVLEDIDAAHAIETDGKDGYYWKLEKPADEVEHEMPQPDPETDEEDHHEEGEQ